VVEAKRLGIGREEMLESIAAHWQKLGGNADQSSSPMKQRDAKPKDGGRG